MSTPDLVADVTVLVSADGSDWRDVSAPLSSATVEDDDRLTDKAVVRFDDATGLLADASFEGLELRIAFGDTEHQTYLFEGVVTETRVRATASRQLVELTALDFSYRMSGNTFDPAEWRPGEQLSSVLARVVGRPEYGITPFRIDPATDVALDERRAGRPADLNEWEFVLDQAQRHGCLAFVEFDGAEASNFYFTSIANVVATEPIGELHYGRGGGNLIEFCYERSAMTAAPRRSAATLDPVTGAARAVAAPAAAARPPLPAPATSRVPDLEPKQWAAIESLTELAAVAAAKLESRSERVSGSAARTADEMTAAVAPNLTSVLGYSGRGITLGTASLRAKSRVYVSGVSTWAQGDWYLRRVDHTYRRTGDGRRPGYFNEFFATR